MFSNCTNLLGPISWFLLSFLLGYLLRYFLNNRKLKRTEDKLSAALAASGSTSGSGGFESGVAVGATEGNDLKLLEGVGPRVENILNTHGISTYSKLAETDPSDLRSILDKEGGRFRYLDPTSWPQQAGLARDGRWEDLEELQEELIGGVYYGPSGQYKDADDLKRIEGIGPRVEGLLNNKGIHTWKQLADSDTDNLKDILKVAGGRYREMNPTSWPRQANLAANGKWEELDTLQEELIGGEYIAGGPVGAAAGAEQDDLKAIEGIGTNVAEILNNAGINSYEDLSSKSPQELRLILDKEGERFANLDPTSWPQQAWLATSGRWKELSDLQDELIGGLYVGPSGKAKSGDDLTRLEGITPRVEGLLHSAGITSFKDLEDTDSVKLRGILSAAGAPYNSLDTSSWGKQAGMAAEGKWDELDSLQDELVSGAYGSGGATTGGSGAGEGDDLREIEGIGRSAAKALNDAGINTFEELSAKSPEELKGILAAHGTKFAGLDTGSWPRQAAIAANGNWDELESLQDELTSGSYTGPSFTFKNDLKAIEGIGRKTEGVLNGAGINTYEDLSEKSPTELTSILNEAGDQYKLIDPASWPQQAGLAAKGDWDKLDSMQEELVGGQFVTGGTYGIGAPGTGEKDDLKVIEGIGRKTEGVLNDAGIHTYEALSEQSPEELKGILDSAGDRYKLIDPSSWTKQAELAAIGDWEELDSMQEELVGGQYVTGGSYGSGSAADGAGAKDDLKAIEGIGRKTEEALNRAGIHTYEDLASKSPEEVYDLLGAEGDHFKMVNPASWSEQAKLAAKGDWDELDDLQGQLIAGIPVGDPVKNDLKVVEGIGKKIEGLLNEDGIQTWKKLSETTPDHLRDVLVNKGGKRYRMHKPDTWPEQAALAHQGKWDELSALQDELIGGVRQSDLKAIEGIGRKTEEVLNNAGINTYEELAAKSPEELKGILAEAGDQYKLIDPSSWSKQAELAANDEWDELDSLQDEFVGGQFVAGGAYGIAAPGVGAKDDLKAIEGIGRRAEEALNKAGINTYEELADKSPEELQAILEAEGDHFRMVNPGSWSTQAGLAAKGEWGELDDMQNQLIAGVPIGSPVKNDLTVIEGIGRKIEGILNEDGIHTWEKLSQSTPDHLRGVLVSKGGSRYKMHNPDTWPEQAALAHNGKWDQLNTLQDELIGGVRQNDLKAIEGIGPRMEGILNKEGILTWQQLAETDPNRLKEILGKHGTRYAMVDPTSWPRQASLATVGNWEELESLQDDLTVGRIVRADDLKQIEGVGPKVESLLKGAGITTLDQVASSDANGLKTILDNAGDRYRLIDPTTWPQQAKYISSGNWGELENIQANLNPGAYAAVAPGAGASSSGSGKDDLKRIEGIGPKIEKMLNKSGIQTWDKLANTEVDDLNGILATGGDRYKIHDPGTWPEQAALAARGDWERLDVLQEELIGGVRVQKGSSLSAPSKGSGKGASLAAGSGKSQKDDLKKVEGIGPKIEKLLNADGIMTWRQLSEAEIDRLKRILDAAGPRYRIHDPGTWPQQAGLAADGKWDELEKLQDELSGGKEKK